MNIEITSEEKGILMQSLCSQKDLIIYLGKRFKGTESQREKGKKNIILIESIMAKLETPRS